ncbi:conserved hypothetical protein [Hyphomicrobiales bacterium]|nr:conserved hypothetical protein [Hyphomicrobiales bacterium]CAH1664059.1 conserved hypothetical protein [Hyphomicrobiales bacterium]
MSATQIRLSGPQFDFVTAEEQFPAFVGGFGSGKTYAAISRAISKKLQYPGQNVAYYLPTYDLVRTMGFPRFTESLATMGLKYKLNKSDAVIEVGSFGSIVFRTMDTPERIIAYEVADSLVDELDTLPVDKARDVWNKIIGRNRQKKPDGSLNTVAVATTPEGFRFVYNRWQKSPAPGYRLIEAPTESNAKNLPEGYIQSLRDSYPTALLAAYLDGKFVNLASGSVYPEFKRNEHASGDIILAGETLHVGMDFNVQKMAAVIFVLRKGEPHAVQEYTGVLDTPAMIALLKSRHPDHPVMVYPDASGNSRRSNGASESDIALLKQARFQVCVNPSNPAVKDRVLAVNAMLKAGRLGVNLDRCPSLVEAFEQQAYDKNGEPDKSSGHDHVVDAAGYFIAYKFPIVRPGRAVVVETGFH